ncbi:MAG: hypothetical protein AB1758_10285 [Candidatus Eremiobacterota bacterium]
MRRDRGHTLIEILVACSFFLLVLGVITSSSSLIRQAYVTQQARIDARQSVRNMVARISGDLRRAEHLYLGFQGNVQGHAYDVPAAGQTGADLLLAIPENADTGSVTYTVVGLYTEPRQPVDPRNPSALQVVVYECPGVTPPVPDVPGSIVLTALGGGTFKRFDCFVPPGNFRVTTAASGRAATLDVWFQRIPPFGPAQLEHYVTGAKLRNVN